MEYTNLARENSSQDLTARIKRRPGHIRVAVVGEDAAFRAELRSVLSTVPGVEVTGEAQDGAGAEALTAGLEARVLFADYAFCRGLQAREGMERETTPRGIRIAVLTTPDKAEIIDCFRRGAQGIVLRGAKRRVLRRSIRAVLAGHFWLGNESLAALVQAIRGSSFPEGGAQTAAHFGLTPREIEIVRKIADGRSNKEVGQDFSIRERTVKHHLTNIFGKVGVSSRLELALLARGQQLGAPGAPEGARVEHERERGEPGGAAVSPNGKKPAKDC
jgi:two-component system nitrate/nitrite response regulator NarL